MRSPATVATGTAPLLVPLSDGPGPLPSLVVHAAGGGLTPYLGLAAHLSARGPVTGIRAAGLLPGEVPHRDVPAMADCYAGLAAGLPRRPAVLVGWSMGGVLAWEVAVRLGADGAPPAVVLIDSVAEPDQPTPDRLAELGRLVLHHAAGPAGGGDPRVSATVAAHVAATSGHRVTSRHDGEVLLLACGPDDVRERLGDWAPLAPRLRVHQLPGGHFDVFTPDVLPVLLGHLDDFLDDLPAGSPGDLPGDVVAGGGR